ncbi:MAG: Fic family protein [Methylotenera sp.]|nr:Fic family protein [Oligoflexia bacterium]
MPAHALSKAVRLIEQLPRADQADPLDHLVSHLFLRREAVQSSRMEGTWSTIDHVFTPGEIHKGGEVKSELASVLGYAHALEAEFQAALKTGQKIFSKALVCRLHKKVVGKDPAFRGISGQVRNSPVFIGGLSRKEASIYNPTPPRHIERCLKQSMEWHSDRELIEFGDSGMGMALPTRMAIGHAHFEAVHPFSDGNGRVGRMLMTLQMAAHQVLPLYLSGYIEVQKDHYMKALREAQKRLKFGPIVEFICEAILDSHAEMKDTKSAIVNLPDEWRSRGSFRSDSSASRILELLITNPIITVSQIQDTLKVTRPAANNAAAQLVHAKVLRERTGQARNRLFAAEEVLELLARKFSEPPSAALLRARQLLLIE